MNNPNSLLLLRMNLSELRNKVTHISTIYKYSIDQHSFVGITGLKKAAFFYCCIASGQLVWIPKSLSLHPR